MNNTVIILKQEDLDARSLQWENEYEAESCHWLVRSKNDTIFTVTGTLWLIKFVKSIHTSVHSLQNSVWTIKPLKAACIGIICGKNADWSTITNAYYYTQLTGLHSDRRWNMVFHHTVETNWQWYQQWKMQKICYQWEKSLHLLSRIRRGSLIISCVKETLFCQNQKYYIQ